MKTNFFAFVFALLIVSCSSDDDGQQNPDLALDGPWSLVNVSGGLAGVDDDFETGLIIWDFNQDNFEVTVNNNNTVNVVFDGLPSGTYNYQILTTIGEDLYLVIDSFSYRITLSSTELLLDEGIVLDGFLLTFR